MFFPLTLSDFGLWLAVTSLVLFVASELIYLAPGYATRATIDRNLLRYAALGCGIAFFLMVVLRIMGMM